MATLVRMRQVLDELQKSEQTDEVQRRCRTIEARIALRLIEINKLIELTGCRRRVLERKHGEWIRRRIISAQADAAIYQQARMRANSSNASRQLRNWK